MTYKHPTYQEAGAAMMRLQARNAFYSEARAIMDRHDLPPDAFENVLGSLVHKAYMREIEPSIRQISNIMSLAMPSYFLRDGVLEKQGDGLTDELRALVDAWKRRIDAARARYYGENPSKIAPEITPGVRGEGL